MMRCHEDTMMLRSTTGSYGRPIIEVAYGEMIFHSTEVVWEMLTREEWLGCQHDASPMCDIPGSTPMWAPCILLSDFQDIKTYVYVYYFSKSICSIKEHWWSLTLSWLNKN